MKFIPTELNGVFLVELARAEDFRGFFARVWSARTLRERGLVGQFVECNMSRTRHRGTIRGLHYQEAPHEEAKLVRCTRGAVYDVVVDLRPDSPTFHRWAGFELKASVDTLIYVPTGCAHGIQTLEDDTEIMYAVSAFHAPEAERGLRWDDPFFNITWPVAAPIVSAKDAQWPNYQHSVAATGCAGS
jgi:dTDP-4-dehydrorhamnose 3,5-epimerase